jgi:hypothetical protein
LPLCLCEACQPDFGNCFSRNSVQWKYGLDYTLTNGVGKLGKTGRSHASKSRFSGKKFQKFGCSLSDLRISDVPQDGIDRQRIDAGDRLTPPTSVRGEATIELPLRRVFRPFVPHLHLPHSRQASGPCQCTTDKMVHRKPL